MLPNEEEPIDPKSDPEKPLPNEAAATPDRPKAIEKSSEQPKVIVRKRTIIYKTANVAVTAGLVLLALAFLIVAFSQTSFFRRLVVNELVKTVESSTNGTLVIKDIQGNIFSGFVLNDVSLLLKTNTKYDTVPFLHVDHVLAQYSLIRYLRKNQIGVVSMVLQHPVVRMVKFTGDTTWNTHLLFKPTSTVKKTPKPFTQLIDLESLRIQNGSIRMRDYNARPQSTSLGSSDVIAHAIDWRNVDVEGLDVDSRFYAKGGTAQSINVSHLRFTEMTSGFFVQHLEFSGYLDSIQARMDNANIVTGHTTIGFSLEVVPPSVIKTGLMTSMEHSSVHLKLNGPTISTYELRQFLPNTLDFLNGSPGIDLETTGEFGHLHIDHLDLDFRNRGGLKIAGDLNNLQRSRDLFMDLTLSARSLSNQTLIDYVPGLHIPNLSNYGIINIPALRYTGEPLNFKTLLDVRTTGAGNVKGPVALDLRNHGFLYTADLTTSRVNLAAIMKNPKYASDLNLDFKAHGNSTRWRTLTTQVNLKTTAPSTFQQYRLNTLDMAASMAHGIADIQHLDAVVEGGPVAHIKSARIDLATGVMPYAFDGTVTDLPLSKLLKTSAPNPAKLDIIANVTGSAKNVDALSGTIHARLYDLMFQGHRFRDVNLDAHVAPSRSGNNQLTVKSDVADISIDHRFQLSDLITTIPQHVGALVSAISHRDFPTDSSRALAILSPNCTDSIDFDYFVHLKDLRPLAGFIPNTFLLAEGSISGSVYGCPKGEINLILEADSIGVILRDRKLDSTSGRLAMQPIVDSGTTGVDSSLMTLLSNATLVSDTSRNVKSDTSHRVKSDTIEINNAALDTLRFQRVAARSDSLKRADSLRVSPLALPKFGSGTPRIHVTPATLRIEARHITNDPHTMLDHLDASLLFNDDSVMRLGSALLFKPHIALSYKERTLDFDIATIYNDVFGVRLNGDANFPTNEFDITIDTLIGVYFNHSPKAQLAQYRWFNEAPSHIRIKQDGLVAIDTLRLVHPLGGLNPGGAFVQRLALGGMIKGDSLDAWVHIPQFDLQDIPKLLPLNPKSKTMRLAQFDGTVQQLDLRVKNTLERPDISLKLQLDSLIYSDMRFDSAYADLVYKDQTLRGSVMLHVDTANFRTGETTLPFDIQLSARNEFRAQIDSIPLLITFKHGPTYAADSAAVLTRPMSASINASHFPIDIATPFIPVFTTLTGAGDIHFAISGTQEHIVYDGFATVHDGSFLLTPNNMYYFFDGKVAFKDSKLSLSDFAIRNVPADDPYGAATFSGFFDFKGFSIKYFDLILHTDRLRVLSNESKTVSRAIYGPLTINTGGQDFHFMNSFNEPWLKGTIGILNANLSMPQSEGYTQSISTSGIVYRVLPNDSMIQKNIIDSSRLSDSQMLGYLENPGTVRMTPVDDSLFPNKMKDLYLDENGVPRDTSATGLTAPSSTLQPSFVDRLRADMSVTIQGDTWLNMPFGGIVGILGLHMSAQLQTDGPITIKRGDDLHLSVVGDLILTPNSNFRFYQTFNVTTGRISFRNSFKNPDLNIVANYVGPYYGNQAGVDQAKLEIHLTGTMQKMQMAMSVYEQKGGTFELYETGAAAQQDVLYYLLSGGSFKSDLDEQGQVNALSRAASSLYSDVFSTLLSGLFGSSGSAFTIRSAALRFGGAGVGLQLTAAYRNITIRYNSNAVNDPLRADYVVDIPWTAISPTGRYSRHLHMEMDLHTTQSQSIAGSPADQPLFLAKLLYQILL